IHRPGSPRGTDRKGSAGRGTAGRAGPPAEPAVEGGPCRGFRPPDRVSDLDRRDRLSDVPIARHDGALNERHAAARALAAFRAERRAANPGPLWTTIGIRSPGELRDRDEGAVRRTGCRGSRWRAGRGAPLSLLAAERSVGRAAAPG